LFGDSARVLVKDGEFNDVQGEKKYHHHDYSPRYNIIGNNVGNMCPQVICMCYLPGFRFLVY
jgi:hypothetical protein